MKDFIELGRRDSHYGRFLVYHPFFDHVHCHIQGCKTSPLSDTALEHPEFAVLDGEFDVLHVLEVVFKMHADSIELLIYFRHGFLERFEMGVVWVLCRLVKRVRGADAGYDILSLGVDKPFTVEFIVAVCRVAGESDSCRRCVAHVSEYH